MRQREHHIHQPTEAQLAIITSLVRAAPTGGAGDTNGDGPFVAVGRRGGNDAWEWSPAPPSLLLAGVPKPSSGTFRRPTLPEDGDAIGMVSAGSARTATDVRTAVPVVVAWACLRADAGLECPGVSLVLWEDGTALWGESPAGILPGAAAVALAGGRQPAGGSAAATPLVNASASRSREG